MGTKEVLPAILAGGLGTRLRDALPNVPKALAPVAGRPFVTYLLDQLIDAGFHEAVLLTGHLAEEVRRKLGEQYRSLRLTYSHERHPLGTAGAVRAALPLLRSAQVMLLNGDSYVECDLSTLPRFHHERQATISLVVTRVDDSSRFGTVRLTKDDRIEVFVEKRANAGAGWINAGVYLLDRKVIERIPVDRPVSLEKEILPEWVSRGRVFGLCGLGRFLDVGTPESLVGATDFFLELEREALTHAE